MKITLEQKAIECMTEEASLAIAEDDGLKYCFINPKDLSQGSICPYQGDIIWLKEDRIRIRCKYASQRAQSYGDKR